MWLRGDTCLILFLWSTPGMSWGGFLGRLGPSWWCLGASWGAPWEVLGRHVGVLGSSWGRVGGVLGCLGASWWRLVSTWGVLAAPGGVLGQTWVVLGPSWVASCVVLGRLGTYLPTYIHITHIHTYIKYLLGRNSY